MTTTPMATVTTMATAATMATSMAVDDDDNEVEEFPEFRKMRPGRNLITNQNAPLAAGCERNSRT
jgi:hypothetical protein